MGSSLLVSVNQEAVQRQEVVSLRRTAAADLEFLEKDLEEIEGVEFRVEDVGGRGFRIEPSEQRIEQGRLAGAQPPP